MHRGVFLVLGPLSFISYHLSKSLYRNEFFGLVWNELIGLVDIFLVFHFIFPWSFISITDFYLIMSYVVLKWVNFQYICIGHKSSLCACIWAFSNVLWCRYMIFWLIVLGCKFCFAYFLQVFFWLTSIFVINLN